jgi:hypothetical protein
MTERGALGPGDERVVRDTRGKLIEVIWAERGVQTVRQRLWGKPAAADPLHHPRIDVAHDGSDEVEQGRRTTRVSTAASEPGSVGENGTPGRGALKPAVLLRL